MSRMVWSNFLVGIVVVVVALLLVVVALRDSHPAPTTSIKELATLKGPDVATWDSKNVCVEGYWHPGVEGCTISIDDGSSYSPIASRPKSSAPSPDELRQMLRESAAGILMVKPARHLGLSAGWFESLIRRSTPTSLFPAPTRLHYGAYARISGIYHATGAGEPRTMWHDFPCIEVRQAEIWDRDRGQWRIAVDCY